MMMRIMVGWALAVVVGIAAAATYEETFTPKAGKAYSEDINVWVYTSEFAERFGMPKEWVDDDLKGAYAVAYRVEYVSGRLMFPHKGPDVSMPTERCILDVYVPSDAPIPWRDEQVADFWVMTPSSPTYVLPQSKEDRVWRQRPVGIESPGKKARRPVITMGRAGSYQGGSLLIREYDKTLYPGITYISFNRGCLEIAQTAYWIDFLHDSESLSKRYENSDVAYRVEIPEQYIKRVHQKWYENTGNNAAKQWLEIIN